MSRIIRHLAIILSAVTLSTGIAAMAQQPTFATPILVVNTSFLNVRSADGPQYSIITVVVGGTELPVLATNRDNSWYLVTTPAGNGWVDVSFTLARGDFSIVPLVNPLAGGQPAFAQPLTIGSPVSSGTFASVPTAGATLSVQTFASLNVNSVNLRLQPNDAGTPIGILFRREGEEYVVVGEASDDRAVLWIRIIAPEIGTGWIETAKTTLRTGRINTPTTVLSGAASGAMMNTGLPVPQLAPAFVVINTGALNVRSGPDGRFGVITSLPGGVQLQAVGVTTDGEWFLVRGDFGQGWVDASFVLFRGSFASLPILAGF